MVILNPLENLVLVTLVNYSAGSCKVMTSKDIVTLDRFPIHSTIDSHQFHKFSRQRKVNNVNSMVFLSDLEWSYFIIEGLWDLAVKVSEEHSYKFTTEKLLQIVTKNLTYTAEFISYSQDLSYDSLTKSTQTLTDYLRTLLNCEMLAELK